MASSDRAFHLLASESPDAFRELIDLALPGLLPRDARVDPEDLDESRLDVPASIDADFVARVDMAVVAAATHGRYTEMVSAMQRPDLEPVIIEDLVRFGMDQGFDKGLEQGLERGIEQGRTQALEEVRLQLSDLLRARALECGPEEQMQLDAERSLAKLVSWIALAGTAKSVREILDG